MQVSPLSKEENHPILQLLMLAFAAVVGMLIFVVIAAVIIYFGYGLDALKSSVGLIKVTQANMAGLKILLVAQQLGLFLTPAIVLSILEGRKPQRFYGMKAPKINLLLIVFLIMLCAMPMLALVNELNQQMVLPDFLKGLENWMKMLEEEGAKTTKEILKMTTIGGFLVNLLIIAIIPAICEEFIFRGALQRTLLRWFKNPHVAIWVAAVIFSAIHFQFYGFFPRLFLGAAFGYIYWWTGSIWYTIFAHFVNNGYAVAIAWYLQQNNRPLDQEAGPEIAWYGYLISAILTIALFRFLSDQSKQKQIDQ